MTILQSLNHAYERLALRDEVPGFGYSAEKISFCILLNSDGSVAGAPLDLRQSVGKKMIPQLRYVPAPPKRANGIAPCFLWDKSSYVLGVSEDEKKLKDDRKRLLAEHNAFKEYHLPKLTQLQDTGLNALGRFLETWTPEQFETLAWPDDIKDQNVIFAFDRVDIHDSPAARQLWEEILSGDNEAEGRCLITGERAPIARLHPNIKGIWDGQPSGGSIVSYNLDAFTSYGHEKGANSPVSKKAAFSYTTVLNKYLQKGSKNRIQIGDASTVFWADATDTETSGLAEDAFLAMFEQVDEEAEAYNHVRPVLEKIRNGEALGHFNPGLAEGVRFYILGLAPNAARISIRFWYEDSFGSLIKNYQRYLSDMRIEPADRDKNPALWKLLRETAVQGKAENVAPNLAGEWMRSILTGARFPQTLLSSILMRIRADKTINAKRVSILKSMLVRNFEKEAPVADNPDFRSKGYQLGRLFRMYEHIQSAALGSDVNTTIKDKFYSTASTQPRRIFPLLDRGSVNHLSKLGKKKPGLRGKFEKDITQIMHSLLEEDDPFPNALSMEEQAFFTLGYYHKRNEYLNSTSSEEPGNEPSR